ncbi:gluconate 2-dehydrogenase subunit 3 family protein [Halorientalis pallida]|uniref:Gluconate 2-dehydrogenase subunit 3 family protein n=1 Tax=Halorientalis pallida TaxID=2479928 RepID=A0A498L298_9EURY|nr:gluconate 2-dehydrogenase subunit 3 family protein [Halorientalis pallida]RXK49004.1 gluconate 2-dehydrogenase subunit 3 family protein [Halorientalis pallida]
MELTRRDAVAALGAVGVAGGALALSESGDDDAGNEDRRTTTPTGSEEETPSLSEHELTTAVAVAEAIYPSALEDVERFVTDFLRGRVADDPDRATEIHETVTYLDDYVSTWYDVDAYASLSRANRTEAFERMNADTIDPDPDGGNVQRVRYYLINDLLFALYASPTGGELVGIENPQGHPGGTTSYRRGPQSGPQN